MLAAGLLLAAVGCNRPTARTGPAKESVTFELTLNGKPVEAADLSFISKANPNLVPTSRTGKEGTCVAKLEPGTYTITVTKSNLKNPMTDMGAANDPKNREQFMHMPSAEAHYLVPVQYPDANKTPFKDIAVPSADGKPIKLEMHGTPPAKETPAGGSKKTDGARARQPIP
jgi:hypothetical protein